MGAMRSASATFGGQEFGAMPVEDGEQLGSSSMSQSERSI